MRTGDFLAAIVRSLGFLSRLPVPARFFEGHHGTMTDTARAFPMAGVVVALPAAIALVVLDWLGAPHLMAAIITVATTILVTGALHEDGLADTADGFGGGRDRERSLLIMKDSRIGTYGALALVVSFGLKVSAVSSLVDELSPVGAAACLVATACFSRGLMVWHWQALGPARTDGVAASAGHPGKAVRNVAIVSGSAIAFLCCIAFLPFGPLILALALPTAAVYGFNLLCIRKIGGHTGDTIGATQQLSEITFLCALVLAA